MVEKTRHLKIDEITSSCETVAFEGASGFVYLDEPVTITTSSNTYYYLTNSQYSVMGLTDSSGNLVQEYSYDPYGKQTLVIDGGIDQPFGFTGRRLDTETGLWYFRNRMFDDQLGRFINRDPIGYVDGMNLYCAYFVVNFIDPFGLMGNEGGYGGDFIQILMDHRNKEREKQSKLKESFFGLKIQIKKSVSISKIIYVAPTPIAGTAIRISAGLNGETYNCCNKTGKTEEWGTVSVSITAEIVGGGAFKGLKNAKNSRGSKWKDKKGRFAKGPKKGDTDKSGTIQAAELSPCPKKGCIGKVSGFIKGSAGAYIIGVRGQLSFPIYPKFKKPSFDWSAGTGIVGVEISAGATGEISCSGPVSTSLSLLK